MCCNSKLANPTEVALSAAPRVITQTRVLFAKTAIVHARIVLDPTITSAFLVPPLNSFHQDLA